MARREARAEPCALAEHLQKCDTPECKCRCEWLTCHCQECEEREAEGYPRKHPDQLLPCEHTGMGSDPGLTVEEWGEALALLAPFPDDDPFPPPGTSARAIEAWHRRRRRACGEPRLDGVISLAESREGRLDTLVERYAKGVALWHPDDAIHEKGVNVDLVAETEGGAPGRRRNGSERVILRSQSRRAA